MKEWKEKQKAQKLANMRRGGNPMGGAMGMPGMPGMPGAGGPKGMPTPPNLGQMGDKVK
jgi:hypothetical protein